MLIQGTAYHWQDPDGAWRMQERPVLAAFREQRDSLLTEWMAAPAERPAKPKATPQEKRAAKASAALDRWQRKAKLAATKIKQYRRKVAYYERTFGIAAKRIT